ncbi:MAG TPA: GAF domain-containing protein [Chthonomonadaceae bacterium]|nr:GAF domain-containing protein [Chthonomonadaceae bacterium]
MENLDTAAGFAAVLTDRFEDSPTVGCLPSLQRLARSLVNACTVEQIAEALLLEGLKALKPVGGSVCLLTADGAHLQTIRSFGSAPWAAEPLALLSLDASLPIAKAVRHRQSIFLEASEWDAEAPAEGGREAARAQGAYAAVPLPVQERIVGVLGVSFGTESQPGAEAFALLETAAAMCALAFDRVRLDAAEQQARQEEALRQARLEAEKRENDTRTRNFFGNLTDGMVACNREWRIIYANEAAATLLHVPLESLEGSALPELFPEWTGSELAAASQQVMAGHTPLHREDYWARHDTWLENHLFPTETGIAVLFRDITARKQTELFQKTISDLFLQCAHITEPDRILEEVVPTVCQVLGADGGVMTEIDVARNGSEVLHGYTTGQPALTGTHALSEFITPEGMAWYQQGKTRAVADTANDEQVDPLHKTQYRALQIGAFVRVPFLRSGEWVGTLTVYMHRPRAWRPQEVAFIESIGERAWLMLENARLLQEERERSHQLSLAISEVHHRVKNNLQAVSALLEMQLAPGSTVLPVDALEDSLSQIKTIALVHDLLARDKPIGGVNVGMVLTNLAELLSKGMRVGKQALPIRVEVEPVWLSTKAATSLALIVNELLTNAAKHNELIGREGLNNEAIIVRMWRQEETVHIAVEDSGPGFAPDFAPAEVAHIGLELVLTLVEHDLRGSVAFSNRFPPEDGTPAWGGRVEIAFAEQPLLR